VRGQKRGCSEVLARFALVDTIDCISSNGATRFSRPFSPQTSLAPLPNNHIQFVVFLPLSSLLKCRPQSKHQAPMVHSGLSCAHSQMNSSASSLASAVRKTSPRRPEHAVNYIAMNFLLSIAHSLSIAKRELPDSPY
jgi:hypothetical protein